MEQFKNDGRQINWRADTNNRNGAQRNPEVNETARPSFSHLSNIKVGIYDRQAPDGRIMDPSKKAALLDALFEIMYDELMSDSDLQPCFQWSNFVADAFRAVAVDEESAEFLRDRVRKMPPPWPGARLEVVYKATQPRHTVEVYVPDNKTSMRGVRKTIRNFDTAFLSESWLVTGERPFREGKVYTLDIDDKSFKLLEHYDGFIPFRSGRLEFRVINK